METFVIRVWTSPELAVGGDGSAEFTLRGRVEHVKSGGTEPFQSTEQLLAFVRRAVESRHEDTHSTRGETR